MLTLNVLRGESDRVIERLKIKGVDATETVAKIAELDDLRKSLQQRADAAGAELNNIAKEVGRLFKEGKTEEANKAKERTAGLKEEARKLDDELRQAQSALDALIVTLPNLPADDVPVGMTAEDNVVVRQGGAQVTLPEDALPHWELASKYDIIDFELGNKLTGAGFPVYKGLGARLQRALIAFFLDRNTSAGYMEVLPPIMVNEASGFGTGQLPDK